MKNYFLFLLYIYCVTSFSQIVKGKILDEENQPLAGANIYFDGTTIATISDENGNFTLNYGAKLNSILAISFIGYQTQFITDLDVNKELKVVLKETVNSLSEVVIKKDRFSRKQKIQLFRDYFLGRTSTAKKAKIDNEDDIYFDYNEETRTLSAYSDKPLIIKNDLLGYKITYELVNFELQFNSHGYTTNEVRRSFYAGLTRFEEVNSSNKIIKLREKCYKGSALHFFRNLSNNVWGKDNFVLYKGSFPVNPEEHFTVTTEDDSKKVQVKKQQVEDMNRFVAVFSVLFNKKLQSKILFETDTFSIDKNGINTNIRDVMFSGYMAEQKVGELLPINYGIK